MATVALVAAWVSAEEPVPADDKLFEVTIDLVKDAVYQKTNIGEFAERGDNAEAGRTYIYSGNDALTFFNMKNEMFDTGDLFLKLGYARDNFGGLMRFALSPRSLDDSSSVSMSELIDIYYVWGKIGFFKLWIGRDEYRGVVNRFQNFDDFLAFRNDSFGPIIVNYDYLASKMISLSGSDATNLGKDILGNKSTVLIGEFNIGRIIPVAPVTISIAANNVFSQIDGKGTNESRFMDSYTDYGSTFGARVEAAGILGMVDLAAVYKYQHTDRNYDEQQFQDLQGGQSFFVPEMGLEHHLFGLFTTVSLKKIGLGISAGYSGYLKVHEEMDAASWGGYTSYTYPLWHGFDLRVNYTGLDRFSFTLNNNVSFASIDGDDDPESFITGFWENRTNVQDVGVNQTQSAIVVYNALAAAYTVTGGLTIKFQAASQLAQLKYVYADSETRFIDTVNNLALYLGAAWQINEHFALRGGFDGRLKRYFHEQYEHSSEASLLEWGIPLGLTVKF